MSELIKFPTHIQPGRLSVRLQRVDEIFSSPLTNAQQVVSRGNPVWVWNLEYVDLSDDERDVVQAFLMRCKGSLNTFKVPDFGDYGIRGTMSDWIDIFSGHGEFGPNAINSWFQERSSVDQTMAEDRSMRLEWRTLQADASVVAWKGHTGGVAVNSLQSGKAYVQRMKLFQNDAITQAILRIGSGGSNYYTAAGPAVTSTDAISAPFFVAKNIDSVSAAIAGIPSAGQIGDDWRHADYQLSRCALVCNSENLLAESNNFGAAVWSKSGATQIESGWMDASPKGVNSGGWKLYGNAVNSSFFLSQTITKPMTEDIYTFSLYGQKSELESIQLTLKDSAFSNETNALFQINSGSIYTGPTAFGVHGKVNAEMFDVGSGTYKCTLTALLSSLDNVTVEINLINSAYTDVFTNNGSAGLHIFGASFRKFPFAGPYVPSTDTAIVGTGWQTGSKLVLDGFDPDGVIKAGQRFEVVNRFHNVNSSYHERTEFKRTTKEAKIHREGYAIVEFDPPIRNAPVTDRSYAISSHEGETMHNPVIFHQPEMKARLVAGTIQYVDKAVKYTDITFEIIEDMTQ